MASIKILSLNVGMPKQIQFNQKDVSTGIFKSATDEYLYLSYLNFEGDGQGDLVHHGGKEKAVCVYPYEHYPFWENELRRPLDYGAFGENLTIKGLLESDVCIGDVFKLGKAIVQVSQPRQPCYKLSIKYGVPDMPLKVQQTGYTGFYFRVLEEELSLKPRDYPSFIAIRKQLRFHLPIELCIKRRLISRVLNKFSKWKNCP